jgi:hypothetical protein
MAVVRREELARWLRAYEKLLRTPLTTVLAELFTPEVSYSPSPWRAPVCGLEELAEFWEAGRDTRNLRFTMRTEVIALDNESAVVRVSTEHEEPERHLRSLWVLRFAAGGRCTSFEEWAFARGPADAE